MLVDPVRSAPLRDADADRRKAIEARIALCKEIGEEPTEFLLGLLAQYKVPEPVAPVVEPLEHKAVESAPETVVPRGPGRPRKPSDAVTGTSSE